MTDNEIIKALECCGETPKCRECPYCQKCKELPKDTIDLINRQKAEIERLEKNSKRLKKVQMQLDDAMKMYSTIKAEAVKEFAEKLHDLIHFDWDKIHKQIDNLVKETVGEG